MLFPVQFSKKNYKTNRCFRYAVILDVDKSDRMKDIHQLSAQFLPVGQLLTQINHWNVACTGTVRYEQRWRDGGGHIDVSNGGRKNRSKMSKYSWINSCWTTSYAAPNQWAFKYASVRKLVKNLARNLECSDETFLNLVRYSCAVIFQSDWLVHIAEPKGP